MNAFQLIARDLFGRRLTIDKETFTTKQLRRAKTLYYKFEPVIKNETELEGYHIEALLPSEMADQSMEYIRRTCSLYGIYAYFDENSDDWASKIIIDIPFSSKASLAAHVVEAILLGDLQYQHEYLESAKVYDSLVHFKVLPKLVELTYSLDKTKQYYQSSEEEKRLGVRDIEFQTIHYSYSNKGLNVIQNTCMVTREYLLNHLDMMGKTQLPLSGKVYLAEMEKDKFNLYIFE